MHARPTTPADHRAALLRFIWGYQVAHDGVSPNVRQCARGIGVSTSKGFRLLLRLEDEGAIRRLAGRACAIEVLRKPSLPQHRNAPLFAVPFLARAGRFAITKEMRP